MLIGDLYTIGDYVKVDSELNVTIAINRDHQIFDGHFPGHPILPGVCMIQLIQELVEKNCQYQLMMVSADTIKFLQAIDPYALDEVQVNLQCENWEEQYINIKATIFAGTVSYFKLIATFTARS